MPQPKPEQKARPQAKRKAPFSPHTPPLSPKTP
jgi:hypothetical protein